MLPYPTTELAPIDALRALRAVGTKRLKIVTRDVMLSPVSWATLVSIWNSKRNARARAAYDVDAWGRLLAELSTPTSSRIATRALNLSAADRLAQRYKRVGVARSEEQAARHAKRSVAERRTAAAVSRLIETAQRDGAYRVALDAVTLLGDVLADASKDYLVMGDEGETVAFERRKLVEIARALRPMGPLTAFFDATPGENRLCVRWRDGRGGLNLAPAFERERDWQDGATIAIVFPRSLPNVRMANVEPANTIAPVRVELASGAPAASTSRTARAWLEFKALRPVVAALEIRLQSGALDAPAALALLDEARAFKRTSWGSVLGKWRQAIALAEGRAA